MNSTIELLRERRSVRAYEAREIAPESKRTILEALLRAPTAGNMMLYTVIEIADPQLKATLAETCDHQPFIAKAPWVLLFLADYQRWYDVFQYSGVAEYCEQKGQTMRRPEEGDLFLACCDALIAAQTAVVAAEALGIGSCYIGDIMENYETHRELLQLPRYVFPITMVCFGYPTKQQQERPQPSRFPQSLIVHRNCYQRLTPDGLTALFPETGPAQTSFLPGTVNMGQHTFARKFDTPFMKEMNRSVRAILTAWRDGAPE